MTAPIALDESKSLDVIALGAAIVDILAYVDDAFLAEQDVVKASMTLIDTETAARINDRMTDPRAICGGSGANTIAGLAGLGGAAMFVGKTRDDALGALFRDDIRRIGVRFDTTPFATDAPVASGTARSMIMVTPDAQRTMATDLGVSGLLSVDDLPVEALRDAKIVYLEGYLWDRDSTKDAMRRAAAIVREAGGRVALTLSDTFCVERHRASFLSFIKEGVDVLFANEAEALSLYETDDLEAALAAARADAEVSVITRSEKGCVAQTRDDRVEAAAAPIAQLVDTTGAGDLFAAGFLRGLTTNRDLASCARMGCLAASEVIQHLGARPEADLSALFAEHGL